MPIRVIIGSNALVPPPPPPPPPPGPPCCLSKGTMILMLDGTLKRVEDIVVGDQVRTLNGRGHTVTAVVTPHLSAARRMIRIGSLRMTDDHDIWVRAKGIEGWGTHNYNWWLVCQEYEGIYDVPSVPLMPYREYEFAHVDGWKRETAAYETASDPCEVVYGLALDGGGGFVADGFVVTAEDCRAEDIAGVEWTGA